MILRSGKITGTGAVVLLSTALPQLAGFPAGAQLQAKFVQVITPPGNVASVNIGGSEVAAPTTSPATAGTGFPIPPGYAGQMLPPIADLVEWYDLSAIYVGIAAGDVLYVLYGG
jgi:hypothetical protein